MTELRKLPDGKLTRDFEICDNSLNRYKLRVLVQGIDLSAFELNPVGLVDHNTWRQPIGKWSNLRVDGDRLLGTLEFDRNDEDAVKLYWKYEDGFMNAVSLHVMPISESEAPEMLLPGQLYPTVVTSELLEISVTSLPANRNSVKLYYSDGKEYKLNLINQNQSKNMADPKKEVAAPEVAELQLKLEAQIKLNAKNLVKLHEQRGVVNKEEVPHLLQLAETNYETVELMLDARKLPAAAPEGAAEEKKTDTSVEAKELDRKIEGYTQSASGANQNDRSGWSYYDWFRKDPEGLAAMEKEDENKFNSLQQSFAVQAEKENLKY